MNYKDFQNILVCPVCRVGLAFQEQEAICTNCGTSYAIKDAIPVLKPPKAVENALSMDYHDHYEVDAEYSDYFAPRTYKATAHDERRLKEYILSLIPKNIANCLDVGSGSAWVAEKLCKTGIDVVSLDISFANVKKALDTYKSENHFGVVGDGLKVPFKEKIFDCIIASEVIEHTVEPQLFIAELKGLLIEGGILIISTPYKEELQYSICIHCNQPTPKNAHLHSFDENKLMEYFEPKDRKDVKHYIFGNKALLVLRTYTILQILPFEIWKLIDRIASLIINRKNHIIVKYDKR